MQSPRRQSLRRLAAWRLPLPCCVTSLQNKQNLDYVHISAFRACLRYVACPPQLIESGSCQNCGLSVPRSIGACYRGSTFLLARRCQFGVNTLSSERMCGIGKSFPEQLDSHWTTASDSLTVVMKCTSSRVLHSVDLVDLKSILAKAEEFPVMWPL